MYQQRSYGRQRYSNSGRGSGARRIKSFDPTYVINAQRETVKPTEYVITHTFADFKLTDSLLKNIEDRGYKTLTPVQDQGIAPILEGRDLIGIANTGTGKTAAFLIPLIEKALQDREYKVLIVAPTHELANQIEEELFAFARGLVVYGTLCIGGTNMRRQVSELRRGPNFVIGTPGRLEDLIRSGYLNLSHCNAVVLDEADMMVDIGFLANIQFIVSLLPKDRQSLFFSATIDGKVREVLNDFVHDPVTVSVKSGDMAANVQQNTIKVIDKDKKVDQLHQMLIRAEFEKVLVFGRTKHGVQKLADELNDRGFKADAIHGNKNQSQRSRTLEKFKQNRIQILLATDVASRGLDIPNVSHVINYDLPESYEAYIHRIGRTGRADKKGVALTFIN
jgi:ATP-dependent RNA helicase RhlE